MMALRQCSENAKVGNQGADAAASIRFWCVLVGVQTLKEGSRDDEGRRVS